MKNFLFLVVVTFIASMNSSNAQVKVTSEGYFQVDYTTPASESSLTFGDNPNTSQPRGRWAMEYFNGGLNYWIPWPNTGSMNYALFMEDATGHIGINDGSPSYHLDVNGDIQLSGQIRYYSDERLKTNIKDIGSIIDKVKDLKGVSYKMKKSNKKDYDLSNIKDPVKLETIKAEMEAYENTALETDRFGFIAQDLKKIFPELVDENEEGYLNVDYVGLIPILVEAIKEMETRIEILEAEKKKN